ncbi:hypothetical protein [Actinoplanes sp. DH11]|uniref:hypothetical protein n=1 Tax=Actinoplanes sp. DH11 TaxID=2857011 RepID=UPI001E2F4E33|nr:hypothetical protein [Actinoplanes sp. DH11]
MQTTRASREVRLGAAFATITLATLAVVAAHGSPAAAAVGTERVSVSSGGTQGDADSGLEVPGGATSDDGRYVVFDSYATNLVAGDTNDDLDVFVRDRQAGTTERMSVSSGGAQGNDTSGQGAISGNGRHVVFTSIADNLVPGDTNGVADIFLRDRQAGTTERVSLPATGTQATDISIQASVSDDGTRVAFVSIATDMVPGDTNETSDIFLRDRQAGTTVRVSVSSAGTQSNEYSSQPTISGAGGHVSFTGGADNLVPGDTNELPDLFVRTLQTGTTERVNVATGGGQGTGQSTGRGAMSDDGRFVGFRSDAPDLVPGDTNGVADVFVRDRQAATTERVSLTSGGGESNANSSGPTISDDGNRVAFRSEATNLVAPDTNGFVDVFLRDRQAGTTERVSLTSGGGEGNGDSDAGDLSGDGRHVAFRSQATNLVASDTNGAQDVFVRDLAVPDDDCTITGTGGDDNLTGTAADDVICGLGGDDTIDGGSGDDIVRGGPGGDTLVGGGGADTVDGGGGADRADGGGGDDVIAGGGGDDIIDGGGGHDTVGGGDGADRVDGGGGHDTLGGGSGNDSLDGQGGHDTVTDHDGADTAFGDSGNDHLDVRDGVGGDTADGGSGTDNCATDSGDIVSSC